MIHAATFPLLRIERVMIQIPAGVSRSHSILGETQVDHDLTGGDLQIVGVPAAEILGVVGKV